MAVIAAIIHGGVGRLEACHVGDLALDVGDRLLHRRDLGVEIGLVLPDLRRGTIGRVDHVLLGVDLEGLCDLGDVGLEAGDRRVDGLLIVGDVALRHLEDHAVHALGLRAHQIVLLDGNLLLRHHGACTEQQGARDHQRSFHRLVSPACKSVRGEEALRG